MFKFNNGERVKCLVTGVEGIVTARADYLNGCVNYCVKPPVDKDGKVIEGVWCDEPQLALVDSGIAQLITDNLKEAAKPYSGGPQDTPPER